MVKLDTNWFNTDSGDNILQSVKNNEKLKSFGNFLHTIYKDSLRRIHN